MVINTFYCDFGIFNKAPCRFDFPTTKRNSFQDISPRLISTLMWTKKDQTCQNVPHDPSAPPPAPQKKMFGVNLKDHPEHPLGEM